MTSIFGTRTKSETSWPPRRALDILLGPRLILRPTLRPRMSRIRDRLSVAIYAKVAMGYHDPHWTQASWGFLRLAATDTNVNNASHPYGSRCPCFFANATAEVFDAAEIVSRNNLLRCTHVRSCLTLVSKSLVFLTICFTYSFVKSTEVRSLLQLSLAAVLMASSSISDIFIIPCMYKVICLNSLVSSLVRLSRILGRSSASIGSILCNAYVAKSFARSRIHWYPRASHACVARYRKSWARIGGVHVFLRLGRVT